MIRCVAAIDCGTTTTKCALLDLEGRAVAASAAPAPVRQTADGGVEVDAVQTLADVRRGLAACIAASRKRGAEVLGCAVTNQRATVVCVGADDRPLGPALSWQDMRGGQLLEAFGRRIPADVYFRTTGLPLFPAFSLAKLLWLKDREPERYRRTRRFALLHDFILHGLGCRDWVTDVSNASLTGLLDVNTRRWSTALLDLAGLDAGKLNPLVEPGTPVGRVSASAARLTGLRPGLPLVAGAGDQQCAGVGAGAVEPGTVEITLGTVAVPLCVSDRPALDPARRVTCCVHAVPGRWNCEGLQNAAGASTRWLAEVRGGKGRIGPAAWRAAGRLAPGADGVLFFPYLLGAGAPWWNADATGALLGLRTTHGPAHALRAVLEGVAFENRAILDVFRELGVPVDEVRLTGGGSEKTPWTRIQANVYGVPVVTLENPQATLVGAAVLAACGAGVFAAPREAVRQMVRPAARFDPDPAVRTAYDALYERYADVRRGFDAAGMWTRIQHRG